MRKIRLLLALLLFPLAAWSQTLLVLGDSLSAAYNMPVEKGWVNLLSERLSNARPADKVINASISGDTTASGLSRLPQLLETYRPEIVIIELGANDGLRALSLVAMKNNLQQMINLVRSAGARAILSEVELPPSYGKFYLAKFERVFTDLAKENQILLISFSRRVFDNRTDMIQEDGLHPTAEAQPLILSAIWPILEKAFKKSGK